MNDSVSEKEAKDHPKLGVHRTAGLKQLAEHLGLDAATVSVVLNDVPGRSIPQATRDRIKAAAKARNYQPELRAGYHTQVMSAIGDQLIHAGYFYFTAHHRHKRNLIEDYTQMLIGRGV